MNLLAIAALVSLCPSAPLFQAGSDPEGWDFLDYNGDGRMERVAVEDCPPGYSPEVLRLSGTVAVWLAKGGHLVDGTYVALYRERAAASRDADGVILFGGAFGDDLALEHNTKTMRPHLWLEQDNDTGISFRYAPAEGEDYAVAEAVAAGLVTDSWNETGWIWQKVQVEGGTARAKYWPAQAGEPDGWVLETAVALPGDRFGIRINSGDIDLAWFAADTEDIVIPAPAQYLYLPRSTVAFGEALPITLFTKGGDTQSVLYVIQDAQFTVVAEGNMESTPGAGRTSLKLPVTLPEGDYTIQMARSRDSTPTLARSFRVEAASDTVASLNARAALLGNLEKTPGTDKALREILLVARGLLAQAQAHHDAGDREKATAALRFVDETLAELHGPAGAALREADAPVDWESVPDTFDAQTGVGKPKHGVTEHYRMASRLRFGAIEAEAQSLVMGQAYPIRIPFEVLGVTPSGDYTIQVALRDSLGLRTIAQASLAPDPPTSQWQPGTTYWQEINLAIPRDDTRKKVAQSVVLDELHDLVVGVRDETTGAAVLLENDPGTQPGPIGRSYPAGRFYVSSAPLEIRDFNVVPGGDGDRVSLEILNRGAARSCQAHLRYLAPSGLPVVEQMQDVRLVADGRQPVTFSTHGNHRGRITAEIALWDERGLLTQAALALERNGVDGGRLQFTKTNHVEVTGDGFFTPVALTMESVPHPVDVAVRAGAEVLAAYDGLAENTTLRVPPHFGYYDITATSGDTVWHERLVATVVETAGGQLLVNGEPFIVKGLNVHGMDGGSSARTRALMRILKELGFNALRGDYPPRWQVDMAAEEGLAYTVLAPFSVASTAEIFGRQDGPPLATARALTRQFIARYRDSAGALLWNSCNEITGENIDFLLALYPLYGLHDPCQRPVHYANLYGQDLWQGQDVMAVNYYFSDTQKATDRHPLILRSAAIAAKHGLPMIYTEFNSYHGAVPTTGVEALDDLFTWGVEEAGMAGGFFYMLMDSDRHPGVLDGGYNTHRIMNDAFHRAFDDATIHVKGVEDHAAVLEVRNTRPFTLRGLALDVSLSGRAVEAPALPDLAPGESAALRLPLPEGAPDSAFTVSGELRLETHHGLPGRIPVHAVAHR